MYKAKITADFEKDFEQIANGDTRQRIIKVVQRLRQAPHSNDSWLHGPVAGKHKKWVGRAGHRIVFATCEECRRLGHQQYNRCAFCTQMTDDTVVFFRIFPKKGRRGDYNA